MLICHDEYFFTDEPSRWFILKQTERKKAEWHLYRTLYAVYTFAYRRGEFTARGHGIYGIIVKCCALSKLFKTQVSFTLFNHVM